MPVSLLQSQSQSRNKRKKKKRKTLKAFFKFHFLFVFAFWTSWSAQKKTKEKRIKDFQLKTFLTYCFFFFNCIYSSHNFSRGCMCIGLGVCLCEQGLPGVLPTGSKSTKSWRWKSQQHFNKSNVSKKLRNFLFFEFIYILIYFLKNSLFLKAI